MKQRSVMLGFILICCMIQLEVYPQSIKFENNWIEHHAVQDGVKGMRLHFNFSVEGLKGKTCQLAVYFQSPKGEGLKDTNGSYGTPDGAVAVGRNLRPDYDNSRFNDFTIFMPVDEIHMKSGEHTYYCDIRFICDGKFLNEPVYLTFTGTSNSNPKSNGNSYADNKDKAPVKVDRQEFQGGGYTEYIHNADGSLTMNSFTPCPICHGKKTCQICFGSGGRYLYGQYFPCTWCGGTNKCQACRGTGGTYNTSVIQKDGTLTGNDSNGTRYTTVNGQVVAIDANGRVITAEGGNSGNYDSSNNSNNASDDDRYGNITCPMCKGTGVCEVCGGDCIVDGIYSSRVCTSCDNGKCKRCKGTGKIYSLKSLDGMW